LSQQNVLDDDKSVEKAAKTITAIASFAFISISSMPF